MVSSQFTVCLVPPEQFKTTYTFINIRQRLKRDHLKQTIGNSTYMHCWPLLLQHQVVGLDTVHGKSGHVYCKTGYFYQQKFSQNIGFCLRRKSCQAKVHYRCLPICPFLLTCTYSYALYFRNFSQNQQKITPSEMSHFTMMPKCASATLKCYNDVCM